MGIAYRCDTGSECTFIVWDGEVTPEEWRAKERELFDDPAFPPGPRALADLRSGGGAPHISVETVDEMAEHLREHAARLGDLQFALVPNNGWDKALQFEKRLEGTGITLIVFNSITTACIWLGLDEGVARTAIDSLRSELRA